MKKRRKKTGDSASQLDLYKRFIDALVELRPDVSAMWLSEKRPWPELPENKAINTFVSKLSNEQRAVLGHLLQHARDGGIHDTLAYLNDQINLDGLRLVINGTELPIEPFGTELYYDWTCRREGDPWPKRTSEKETE